MTSKKLRGYDITQTYEWNYANAPEKLPETQVPACPGSWNFCGLPVNSPLGIAAGPLLNSRWVLYYAALGFDVLTYKTVRSSARACYELPNLLPVSAARIAGDAEKVAAKPGLARVQSWAISFGMPSRDPATWQKDVGVARNGLRKGQILAVSVVASPEADWSLDRIAADFSQCARWARDAGAQAIEANLSCPNVSSQEGRLYTSPHASGVIAAEIRNVIGDIPLVLKVGLFPDREQAEAFVCSVDGHASAVSTTNTISAEIHGPNGRPMFGGAQRGIGGSCIRDRCQAELAMLHEVVNAVQARLQLIGVGGIFSGEDARERILAGAHHVQVASAPMLDPAVGLRIRRELAAEGTPEMTEDTQVSGEVIRR
ncbi:MAG: hypothetical protein L0387_26920 [Acidobacteria bacterium]|nr:hypothetical protein [Acidobacteriota bacterium]